MPLLELTLNGERRAIDVAADRFLVDCIREDFRLTGTHVGCDTVQCGACTVRMNGKSVKSCATLAIQAQNAEITTIEGLASSGSLHPLQKAFSNAHALQCGFCTPGMLIRALELADDPEELTHASIRKGLGGNLCRCTGYNNIVTAIEDYRSAVRADSDFAYQGRGGERIEDQRLVCGGGRFTADAYLPQQAYACFLRSSVAHGVILSIETEEAQSTAGVLGVFTAEDLSSHGLGQPDCSWKIPNADGSSMRSVTRPLLAKDRVRYVGEPIAIVVAESEVCAKQARDRIRVSFEELAATVNAQEAPGLMAPLLHADVPENRAFEWEMGDEASANEVMASAAHTVELCVPLNRVQAACMEPRAALAEYAPADGRFTLHVTTQNPHVARRVIAEDVGLAPEHLIDVVSADVGGSFGSKIFVYSEECVCLWAAREIGRPVKWVATRTESFQQDVHGRDIQARASLALDDEGHFLALQVFATANLGAYLSPFAAIVPTFNFATMLVGPYRTPEIHCAVTGVYTNTTPVDAYRGAGRPDATYLLETIIDRAATELGMDRVELRRRNLIPKDEIPYQTPAALVYDSGDYQAHFDKALALAEVPSFQCRRKESAERGLLRGLGIVNYLEACGIGPSAIAGALGAEYGLWEAATLRFLPTGVLEVFTGSHSQGQGHETAFTKVVQERLALPQENILVRHGDTRSTPVGMGTYGSRSLVVGGSAIVVAIDKLIEKGRLIAAHLMFCEAGDVVFGEGEFRSSQDSVSLAKVISAAYAPHDYPEDLEPGFEVTCFYDPANFTYPSGTHICEVEIDPATGRSEVVKYTAVDDFGKVVSPAIVDGQVHGGVAQGIGQALMEEIRYEPLTGQLLTDSLWNYALPRATDIPVIQTARTESVCEHNPLGAKGCGEAGAIAAPPAVSNAIADAIGQHIGMPASSERIWRALNQSAESVHN
ncbi:MAG: molybdopterin-dependent oxidoreductase [Pseudomonadota bacterium]